MTLASTTQRTYRAVWDAHVRDRFDHHRLNQIAALVFGISLFLLTVASGSSSSACAAAGFAQALDGATTR